ncbi:MAG: hypothetical protein HRT57_02045, partial [Crocinitomicaceae bacterium]|nr:hypothetical protein [Crocinitomicaceae bacterium]
MININRYILFFVVIAIVISCKPKKLSILPVLGDVDTTTIVAIGGNSFAGYSDDALHREGQEYSIPSIVIDRMGGTNFLNPFTQPYISSSSVGINLNGDSKLIMAYKTDCNNETSLSPVRKAISGNMSDLTNSVYSTDGPFYNLSVPGLDCDEINNISSGDPASGPLTYNPWIARIARDPMSGTLLSDAIDLNPTFLFLSVGMDEIVELARAGVDPGPLNSAGALIWFSGLGIIADDAQGVISTVPDVLVSPYFTAIPYNGLELDADQATTINSVFNPLGITFQVGENGFTMEDANEPFGVRKIVEGELILLSVPLDSIKCYGMGSIVPIPDKYVLSLD